VVAILAYTQAGNPLDPRDMGGFELLDAVVLAVLLVIVMAIIAAGVFIGMWLARRD
jgi:hypothetical protein